MYKSCTSLLQILGEGEGGSHPTVFIRITYIAIPMLSQVTRVPYRLVYTCTVYVYTLCLQLWCLYLVMVMCVLARTCTCTICVYESVFMQWRSSVYGCVCVCVCVYVLIHSSTIGCIDTYHYSFYSTSPTQFGCVPTLQPHIHVHMAISMHIRTCVYVPLIYTCEYMY